MMSLYISAKFLCEISFIKLQYTKRMW